MRTTSARHRITKTLGALAALAMLAAPGVAQFGLDGGSAGAAAPDPVVTVEIGPIPGITTAWHVAPGELSLPAGTPLMLRASLAEGTTLRWLGVHGTAEETGTSTAFVQVDMRSQAIGWTALDASGIAFDSGTLLLHALEFLPATGTAVGVPLSAPGSGSFDAVVVTPEGPFATALDVSQGSSPFVDVEVGQPLLLGVSGGDDMPAPWEWRLDGEAIGLGALRLHTFDAPGDHVITVGPAHDERRLFVHVTAGTSANPQSFALITISVVSRVYWSGGGVPLGVANIYKELPLEPGPCTPSGGGAVFLFPPLGTLQISNPTLTDNGYPVFSVDVPFKLKNTGCGPHNFQVAIDSIQSSFSFQLDSDPMLWLGSLYRNQSENVTKPITITMVDACLPGTIIPVTLTLRLEAWDPGSAQLKTLATDSITVFFSC